MRSPRSADEVASLVASGANPKFLFFWGHTPPPDGSISKACFSQWWESSFEVDAVDYPTAEHYMRAAKARLLGDSLSLEKILAADHPKQAKELGRSVAGFNEAVWVKHRFEIVVAANEAKFRQNPELAQFLISTGSRVLAEASPVDRIWGIGMAADDRRATNPQQWRGLNLLGFALMEVRERIISS
jgi:ribA/ribD-fused uncharacterized protein